MIENNNVRDKLTVSLRLAIEHFSQMVQPEPNNNRIG